MKTQHIQFVLSLFAIDIALLTAHWVDLWPMLGGHPVWSSSATYLGIGIGSLMATLSHSMLVKHPRHRKQHLWIFVSVAFIAVTASIYGKIDFVASYGDDQLAGRVWYYGFIMFIAGMPGGFATAVKLLRGSTA